MAVLVGALVCMAAVAGPAPAEPKPNLTYGKQLGLAHVKGAGAVKGVAQLAYHNGEIMTAATVTPIFWGTSWATHTGDTFDGINAFYAGLSDTAYMKTNVEYTGLGMDGSKGRYVGSRVTALPHIVNGSAAGTAAPSTATVLSVVQASIGTSAPADGSGYYPVYSDIKRGSAKYCAWHSYGTINGVKVQFAFFFDLTGDPGCDPGDTRSVFSQNVEALANVSGHELSEAVTDPRNGGYWDRSGAENSDKCAWTFDGNLVTLTNGTAWKIQGNWSNAKAGCIFG